MKKASQIALYWEFLKWVLMESAVHGTGSREAWRVQRALATKCFPRVTAAVLTFPFCEWTQLEPVKH